VLIRAAALQAQAAESQTEATVPTAGMTTLHVYANLIQMPVLVLSPDWRTVPVIKPERFSVSLDNGPAYRPTHVRIEGADPISLTIVLDFIGTASKLIPKINETIERVIARELTPRDHVSLLVMECSVLEMLQDRPAEPGILQPKITEAVDAWAHRDRSSPCKEKLHLWDTLAVAAMKLSDLPGRRVIIAVTDAADRGSRRTPEETAGIMQTYAVATFGIRPDTDSSPVTPGRNGTLSKIQPVTSQVSTLEPFERMCELSGGVAFMTDKSIAGKQFARILELVRGRYILEFPRPSNATAGAHILDVKISKSAAFIRSSGTSVPLPDPKIAADPTTLPNDPTLTPEMGKPKTIPHLLR